MLLINPYRFAPTRFISNDADVVAYVLAVESADGQELELGVITAVETFITGCKSDGIWGAIKASCILAGARTLSGALVPLVGTAPTNYNFVSADYNRETGLKGDGATKFLNPNRNNNADPQNSKHIALHIGELHHTSGGSHYLLTSGNGSIADCSITFYIGHRLVSPNGSGVYQQVISSVGFKGTSRSNSADFQWQSNGSGGTYTNVSRTPSGNPLLVFRRGGGNYTTTRISFYSIGESLDLAALDSRVSTLMTDLATAIP